MPDDVKRNVDTEGGAAVNAGGDFVEGQTDLMQRPLFFLRSSAAVGAFEINIPPIGGMDGPHLQAEQRVRVVLHAIGR
jgi:hypothetical protein